MKGAATSRNAGSGPSSGAAATAQTAAVQTAQALPEDARVGEAEPGRGRPRGNTVTEWLASVSWPRDLLRLKPARQ